jgi:hypothetical protein
MHVICMLQWKVKVYRDLARSFGRLRLFLSD